MPTANNIRLRCHGSVAKGEGLSPGRHGSDFQSFVGGTRQGIQPKLLQKSTSTILQVSTPWCSNGEEHNVKKACFKVHAIY